MELRREFEWEKLNDGYEVTILYEADSEFCYNIVWPVHLKHTPKAINKYISQRNLSEAMARSVRRWCYSGYSYEENGFFLGRESGSELNYIDAYEKARQSEYIGLSPLDYYLVSTRRRPVPATLKQPIPEIVKYLDMNKGGSIYANPCDLGDMDFISWVRYESEDDVEMSEWEYEQYLNGLNGLTALDELPF